MEWDGIYSDVVYGMGWDVDSGGMGTGMSCEIEWEM